MRKILSFLLIAMFLVGLAPAAFAANDGGKYQTGGEREAFISQAEQRRAELQERREETASARTREKIDVAAKREEQLRRFQENKQEMLNVVANAIQRRADAIQKYREAKAQLAENKEKLKACKGLSNAACTEERIKARKNSQKLMLNAADRILGLLEKAKTRVQESDQLSEEEKATAIAALEDRMQDIASARETIEQTTEAATKEEIKESATLIREAWRKANKEIKEKASRAAVGKIGGTLVKIEKLEAKLERTVNKLKSQGIDTTPIETMMQQFENKIQEAKDAHAIAMQKFQEGNVNEATVNVRAAHRRIKEAHMLLKDVVRKIRKASQGEKIQEGLEPETEAEEAAQEAAEEAVQAGAESTDATETAVDTTGQVVAEVEIAEDEQASEQENTEQTAE